MPTKKLFFSLLFFKQLRSILLCKDAFQIQLWYKLSFASLFFSFQWSSFYFFIPESLWCFSLRPIISFRQDHVLSLLIYFTGVLCPLFKFFSSYQALLLFSIGVLSEFFRCHSLPISFQPEWFWNLACSSCQFSSLCNLWGLLVSIICHSSSSSHS